MLGITTLIVACICSTGAFSQKITITEVNKRMSQGKHPGLMVFIPQVSDKVAEKEWKRLLKEWDCKPDNKRGEVFADDAFVSSISSNTVDVYADFKSKNEGTEMIVDRFERTPLRRTLPRRVCCLKNRTGTCCRCWEIRSGQ